jgi:hypothetical protein
MSDMEKVGLFIAIIGLALLSGKASAKLAREIGVPTLLISLVGGAIGHRLAEEL